MDTELVNKRSHWVVTTALIVTDVIGSGVLALPFTLSQLGWLLGIASLLILGYVSLYTGLLLGRLYSLYPRLGSYSDLGEEFLGKVGRAVAATLSYLQMFGLCVVFLVGMTILANQVAQGLGLPSPCFLSSAALICAATLVFAQVRNMSSIGHFSAWIALPTLYLCLALLFYQLLGPNEELFTKETEILPPVRINKIGVAFMNIVLTYAGHVVYFEFLGNMSRPQDFGKAVYTSQAIIMITYLGVAIPVYLALGGDVASPFQLSLQSSATVAIANASMLLHVLFSLLINHHVISKVLFEYFKSLLVDVSARASSSSGLCLIESMSWAAVTASVMALAWIVANLVPFFSDIMALLSSVAALNLTYGFPAAAALLQHRRQLKRLEKNIELEDGNTSSSDSCAPSSQIFVHPSVEVPLCWMIVVFSAIMMIFGIVSALQDTIDGWASISRRPFEC